MSRQISRVLMHSADDPFPELDEAVVASFSERFREAREARR